MKLFEQGKIGKMVLKNRIVMAPMGTSGLADKDYGYSQRLIDFYAARARGSVGIIITGSAVVNTELEAGLTAQLPRLSSPTYMNRLKELCDAVHHYGAKLVIQLTPGFGRVNYTHDNPIQPISASAVPCFWDPRVITRALTIEEIDLLVKSYGVSAGMAKASGVDAIEIHGYGGYLMDQFQTSLWNKRTDKYGGDLDGRLRFSMEIISAARSAVGKDFPLIYKFTPDHYIEGGRKMEEGLEIARRLEKASMDALHVSGGCYEVWHRALPCMYEKPGSQVCLAEAVKKQVKIPIITDGKLGHLEMAEKVIEEEKADFIALGRPLLADPEWPRKVKEGRLDDIIPCIGDGEGCLGGVKYLSCTVNPATGMEKEYALKRAERRKRVLVIGGGPGGLEAARVAALRGHEVTLWEKEPRLGGKMIPASVPDFKQDIRPLIEYLSNQVNKLGVKVELVKEATLGLVQQINPEVVIVATGGTSLIPQIPGIKDDKVSSAVEVLLGKKEAREIVIVVGGGMVGCETAAYLARQGKKVTIVEMMGQLIPEAINAVSMFGLLALIKESKVKVLTKARLLEVTGKGAIVDTGGSKTELNADSVVLALGFKSESSLREHLEGRVPELFAVGDCVQPRNILYAMWEGFHASRVI